MQTKDKIRLILLEGKSDKLFFDAFKGRYASKRMDIILLKGRNQDFKKIEQTVKSSVALGYRKIWLVIDLKTQKIGLQRYYENKKELLKEYGEKLRTFDTSDVVVVIRDLECWQLLYFNKYRDTEKIKDGEDKIKQLMEIKDIGKIQMTQQLLRKADFWDKLVRHKNKNKSFRDFLHRVDPER